MSDVLVLPKDVSLEYFAEGGANVIYIAQRPDSHQRDGIWPSPAADLHSLPHAGGRTSTPPPTEISPPESPREEALLVASDDLLSSHLLRLHKAVPWLTSTREQFDSFDTIVRPLFSPEHLLRRYLVRLPSSITAAGNAKLHEGEARGTRPTKRQRVYLDEHEQYGLLVEDMSSASTSPRNVLTVELKPKWLAQSPNAPRYAARCRTCALWAMRRAKRKYQAAARSLSFCPLALISRDANVVSDAVEAVLSSQALAKAQNVDATLKEKLVRFFLETSLLSHLRELQVANDSRGILATREQQADRKLQLAMTLRDCTLYVRVRKCQQRGLDELAIEGKLGDLDLKMPEPSKISYWTDIERELCEGGWYYASEAEQDVSSCQLRRT